MKKVLFSFTAMLILVSLSLSACNILGGGDEETDELAQTLIAIAFTQTALAEIPELPTETPVPTETEPPPIIEEVEVPEVTIAPTEITHLVRPGNPGWINKYFYDTDSSRNADRGAVTGGDDYTANLYERPFTEGDMVYRPDIDIIKTEMSEDATFYYVTIYLYGFHPEGGLQAAYGIEIDEDRDGRGDLLVIVDRPSSADWDITGVSVWKDSNNDVGGTRILRPDTGYTGNSYDQEIFSINVLDDPDTAWARVSTGSPASVTLAFKKSLLSRDTFVWGVWAADALLDPTLFDHHDHFTQEEAGSPYSSHSTYPLRALNLIDNTCRETYKFEATTPIPGLCYVPAPPTPTLTPTYTATPEPEYGNITGVAFDDMNNNGQRDAGEPTTIYDVTITLRTNSCTGSIMDTTTSKTFNFAPLTPGSYCVSINVAGPMTTPNQYLVTLAANETKFLEFGFEVPN